MPHFHSYLRPLDGVLAALTIPRDTVAVMKIVASMTEIPDVNFRLSRRRSVQSGKMMIKSTAAITTLLASLHTELFSQREIKGLKHKDIDEHRIDRLLPHIWA